jgi:hypothetical protein
VVRVFFGMVFIIIEVCFDPGNLGAIREVRETKLVLIKHRTYVLKDCLPMC